MQVTLVLLYPLTQRQHPGNTPNPTGQRQLVAPHPKQECLVEVKPGKINNNMFKIIMKPDKESYNFKIENKIIYY